MQASIWSEPPTIYMDTWALNLFSNDQLWRSKFFELFRNRGTLAVSLLNIVEIGAHAARCRPELRSFLDAIGPHWVPLTIDSFALMDAQKTSHEDKSACLSTPFLLEYFSSNRGDLSLVRLVDWTRGDAGAELKAADRSSIICEGIKHWRREYAADIQTVDAKWELLPFDCRAPMRPIYNAFLRFCIKDNFEFTEHDARDLQHAIASVGCADMTLLDNRWAAQARKVQKQTKMPKQFVRIYESRRLPQFLADLAEYSPSRGLCAPPI